MAPMHEEANLEFAQDTNVTTPWEPVLGDIPT